MPMGESDFHYSKNIICCKRYDNKSVPLIAKNGDVMSGVSNVIRQTKNSATKTPVFVLTSTGFATMAWVVQI